MDPWHHSESSVRRWGGRPEDYLEVHRWFDATKDSFCDFRHRALRHHAEGIAWCVERFGPTLTTSSGRLVPVRWVGEQHVNEDCGRIPSVKDWLRCLRPEPWMLRVAVKHTDLEGVGPEAERVAPEESEGSPNDQAL